MPKYFYRAKQGPDKTVDGELQAESRAAAMQRLERIGFSPLSVEEMSGSGQPRPKKGLRRRVRSRDVTVFTRQLAGLLKAGVPILRALGTIQQQTSNPGFQAVVMDMAGLVRDGKTFSQSLARAPDLFPELYVNMVRAGESAGMLEEILMRLAEARENEDELRAKVVSAIAYPLFVLAVGALSVFVILAFFLPRIVHIFDGLHQTLPWATRVVLALSGFFSAYWPVLVAGVALAGLGLARYVASREGRLALDSALLNVPVMGAFIRDTDVVRFARTLSLLVRAGISVDKALSLAANTLANTRLRLDIAAAADETIRLGATIADGFKRRPGIPDFVTNMVAVGEESGRLEDTLLEVASFYQRELDRDLRLVTTLLEPVLILGVGAVVGFIIFAMLLPIFQIGQVIH